MSPFKKAFSLIELLTMIVIIVILMGLATGTTRLVRERGKIMTTRNTLKTIHEAVALYIEAAGDFPTVSTSADANLLIRALTQRVSIVDYKGEVLKTVERIFSDDEIAEFQNEGLVGPQGGGYVFLDAWGGPILYYYGDVDTADHPYPSKCANVKNVNWNSHSFDLVSKGPDGLSLEATPSTQKDDLTNFT